MHWHRLCEPVQINRCLQGLLACVLSNSAVIIGLQRCVLEFTNTLQNESALPHAGMMMLKLQ